MSVCVCETERKRERGVCVVDMTSDFSVYIYLQVFIVIYVGLIAQPSTRWLCVQVYTRMPVCTLLNKSENIFEGNQITLWVNVIYFEYIKIIMISQTHFKKTLTILQWLEWQDEGTNTYLQQRWPGHTWGAGEVASSCRGCVIYASMVVTCTGSWWDVVLYICPFGFSQYYWPGN